MVNDRYAFLIRAYVPHRHNLTDEAGEVEEQTEQDLESEGLLLKVRLETRPTPNDPALAQRLRNPLAGKQLLISGGDLPDHDGAVLFADRVVDALRALSVVTPIAIDVGDDQPELSISVKVAPPTQAPGPDSKSFRVLALPVVHGGIVFPTGEDIASVTVSRPRTDEGLTFPSSLFISFLEGCLKFIGILDPVTRLAIDLYNQAQFEATNRARFLTLVTCLEVLAERPERSASVVAHVNSLIALTKEKKQRVTSSDEKRDLDSLLGSLMDLKSISITRAVGELGERFEIPNLADAPSFFRKAYRARSELLHDGHWPLEESIAGVRLDLWVAIGDILRSMIRDTGYETRWQRNIG